MVMASQIIAASSPTITKSHLISFPPLYSSYNKAPKPNLSSWLSLVGSSRFSPYIGLKHLGLTISPKSSNPEKRRRCSKAMGIRASLFGVGAPEALVIGVVALLVFGPKGLAEVARNLGKTLRAFQPTIRELQDVSRDFKSTLEREIGLDDISSPNIYDPNRMNPGPPPPPQPSVPRTEDPVTTRTEDPVTVSDPDDAESPKAYTTEEYLKITEEQLKALSPSESQTEDQSQTQEPLQSQTQEPLQPTTIQTPSGESQPNGTARDTTSAAPPRQD